jgi:hypothetical protein
MKTYLNISKYTLILQRKIWVLLPLITLFSACEKDLDVGLPTSQLTGTAIFEDEATVRAALADVYTKMRDESALSGSTSSQSVLLGLYADELDFYQEPFGSTGQFYNHTVLTTNSNVFEFWSQSYKIIYGCNAILEGLEKSTTLTTEQQEPFRGEALLVRAYMHYNLTQLFGDIPYITTTDYRINSTVSRIPQMEVYAKINSDISESRSLLPEEDISGEHIYPDKAVATALLAKVNLSLDQWQGVVEACNQIINAGNYTLGDGIENVFSKESPSTIWQMKSVEGNNTASGQTFIFESGPPPFVALAQEFVNSFEAEDARRTLWIGEVSENSQTWYYPFKYKQNEPSGSSLEYNILLRLAEIYLMRAEARTHLGLLAEARVDLNAVRQRAGLEDTNAATIEDLLVAIAAERRHEFFTEHGLRWFDLVRTGKADEVLAPIKPSWKATDILLPVPQSELLINENLAPQNPGY